MPSPWQRSKFILKTNSWHKESKLWAGLELPTSLSWGEISTKPLHLSVFHTYFLSAYRYSFNIWYIALPYQVTDQVQIWFWSIDFFMRLSPPLDLEKYQKLSVFHIFFLCLQIFIWYLVQLLFWTKLQIKLKFGFCSFIFQEDMTFGLRKISGIFSFPHFFPLCL
jgi:hypothetical protein